MTNNPIHSLEQASPDGKFHVSYNYVDGERSPLITESRVTLVDMGEILVDGWRSSLNGAVYAFSADGFEVRFADPFGPGVVIALVDATARTFRLKDDPAPGRPLADLLMTVHPIIDHAREKWRASFPPPLPPKDRSLLGRLSRLLSS